MTDNTEGEGRISRWSRRKIAVAREELPEEEAVATDAEEQSLQNAELEAELQANREAAEAVDLESLDEESDFSVFMKAGVPEMLKKQAMAQLWRTSPVFANVDGLVDYDDDFGSPDLIMKTFKSAYQAGRGYLDLFKGDEESEEEMTATVNDEQSEQQELSDEPPDPDHDTSENAAEEVEEVIAAVEVESVEAIANETELALQEPVQRVSLRRRLQLDEGSEPDTF